MTPHQRRRGGKPVGSLVLEWERRPIGRIYRATGLRPSAANAKVIPRLKAACEVLFQQGRLDVLEAVRDGLVHPMMLLQAQRTETLSLLPTPAHLTAFAGRMHAWAEATRNANSRTNRHAVRRKLEALAPQGTVGELPAIVARAMKTLAATPATANRLREQAMAFVRDELGLGHPIHEALHAIPALETTPVRKRQHLTPAEFAATLPQLGPAAQVWQALCLTGMNPKEYWQDGWEVDGIALRIHGQKARDRRRVVPLLAPLAPPSVSQDVLIWWLRKLGFTPYDARRSYSRWLEDAGIPPWRVRAYMGHAPANQTEGYQRGDMTRYLVGDRQLLRAHLRMPDEPVQLTKVG